MPSPVGCPTAAGEVVRMRPPSWALIAEELSPVLGKSGDPIRSQPVGGGCINEAYVLSRGKRSVFVKTNAADQSPMFEAEVAGLEALRETETVRIPEVYASGVTGSHAWIAMEYLSMSRARQNSQEELGRQLAGLHRVTQSHYGWERDNTIGSTPQRNSPRKDWVEFLREERLRFQFSRAVQRGGQFEGAGELLDRLGEFFGDYDPLPALLHGDLWSGNVGFTRGGQPFIFDPAVYFGDREAEFGIIEMFGGFGAGFYQGYAAEWPLDPGFDRRKDLYLLYHQLNHFNLFGSSYGPSVRKSIRRLLSRLEENRA